MGFAMHLVTIILLLCRIACTAEDAGYCYKRCSVVGLSDSVCLSVCLSVGHVREPCKNGLTDRDAVWGTDSGRLKVTMY